MRAHGAKNKFCMVIKQNERKIFKVRPQSTSSALDNFFVTLKPLLLKRYMFVVANLFKGCTNI